MGFNKRHLPSKEKLKQLVYDYGAEYVLKIYYGPKVDALVGNTDSFEFLETLKKNYESN